MDEKKVILTKLDELEMEYQKAQKQLDRTMEEVLSEKDHFNRDLENLGNDLSYVFRTQEYTIDVRQAYNMLEGAQEDSTSFFKTIRQKLEDDQDDLTSHYKKKVAFYEEDLDLLKRKESTKCLNNSKRIY